MVRNFLAGKPQRILGRNWQFTWQHVTRDNVEFEWLRKAVREYPADYKILAYEVAPTTGMPHMHAYFQFHTAKEFKTVHNWGKKVANPHIECCRGTAEQNIEYLKKGGDFEEIGAAKVNQGQRTDLLQLTGMIDDGADLGEVARAQPENFVKFHKGIRAYQAAVKAMPRVHRTACVWYWGAAGTGKSYTVKNRHAGRLYIKEPGHKWWDGYTNQEAVLMDDMDFRDGFWSTPEGFRHLLRLGDEGSCQVEYKGGMIEFNSRILYVTSEFPPSHYWTGNTLKQVTSRFGIIEEMRGKYVDQREAHARCAAKAVIEEAERRQFIAAMEDAAATAEASADAVLDEDIPVALQLASSAAGAGAGAGAYTAPPPALPRQMALARSPARLDGIRPDPDMIRAATALAEVSHAPGFLAPARPPKRPASEIARALEEAMAMEDGDTDCDDE